MILRAIRWLSSATDLERQSSKSVITSGREPCWVFSELEQEISSLRTRLYGLEIRELDRYNETRSEVPLQRNSIRTASCVANALPRVTHVTALQPMGMPYAVTWWFNQPIPRGLRITCTNQLAEISGAWQLLQCSQTDSQTITFKATHVSV